MIETYISPVDQYGMSLDELYRKVTNTDLPRHVLLRLVTSPDENAGFRQFRPAADDDAEDATETVRDSIHLDWSPLLAGCPECGVRVRIWDGFAHRTLWNASWADAVAFQPVSTRFETGRWDSPVEGFAFRLWQWGDNGDFDELYTDTFTVGRRRTTTTTTTATTTSRPLTTESDNEEDEDSVSVYSGDADSGSSSNDDDYYAR